MAAIRTRREIELERMRLILRDAEESMWWWKKKHGHDDAGQRRCAELEQQIANMPADPEIHGYCCSMIEMRHYLHAAGVAVRPWCQSFGEFGATRAGMGGYEWFDLATGKALSAEAAAKRARVRLQAIGGQPDSFFCLDDEPARELSPFAAHDRLPELARRYKSNA